MQKCAVFANIDYEGVADAGLQELTRVLPSTSHPVTRLVATLDTVESFGKLNERWKLFKKEQVCCFCRSIVLGVLVGRGGVRLCSRLRSLCNASLHT